MNKRALIIMTDGCEDIEAVAVIDVLTRVGVDVTVAGLKPGNIQAAYGTTIVPHKTINGAAGPYDAIVLPGGRRNAEALAANPHVVELIREQYRTGRLVAAICASPGHVLAEAAGILIGRRATGDPMFDDKMIAGEAIVTGEPVTVDGNIITGMGPGAALQFALMLAEKLSDKQSADRFAAKWQVTR